jgi:multidrug efflux pump
MPNGWSVQLTGRLQYYRVRMVLFVLALVINHFLGKTPVFFPAGDPNFAYVYITMPIGTDQATTNEVTKKIEKRVAK